MWCAREDRKTHEKTLIGFPVLLPGINEKLSLVTFPRHADEERAADEHAPQGPPAVPPRRRRLSRYSARSRILAAVVGLAALALSVAGYSAFVLQQLQVEDRINAELEADAQEFVLLHERGLDPSTGEPFASPADLVRTAMERIIPTRNEGVLGFVDTEVLYTSSVADISLEEDAEFTAALAEYAVADRASITSVSTEYTTYRAVIVPVHADGQIEDTQGETHEVAAFVMAYDMAAEKTIFAEGFITYIVVSVLSLLVVALVGWLVAGRLLHPIRVLAQASRQIGREDLSERIPVSGDDDLTEMTRSVNQMLDRLEGAFRAQDQLIHDVSHELRTPLTILRGHLEVLDVGDREDVIATRELTLDELKRMNRVVDDLTTLAQAEHPEFVKPGPVNLGTLTDEVYDKAIALGNRRWIIAERAEVETTLDRERITQALLQLAANAVKFSPPGSVISLASAVDEDTVRLTVRDQGRGIAKEDQSRVFDRFQRSNAAEPGSGLGLPIVDAIARAHSGRVEVESELGSGATFTICLPRGAPSEPPAEFGAGYGYTGKAERDSQGEDRA